MEAEAMEELCIIARSLGLLSYTTQDHVPSGDTSPSGLGLPTSMINQENALTLPYRSI